MTTAQFIKMSGLICFWSYSHFWLPSLCQRHLTIKIVAQTFQYTILKETIFSLTEFFTIFFTLLPLCPTNLSILPLFQLVLVKQFYFWAFFTNVCKLFGYFNTTNFGLPNSKVSNPSKLLYDIRRYHLPAK